MGISERPAYRTQIAAIALKNGLPTIGTSPPNAEAGFLISYGTNLRNLYYRAATLVDKNLERRETG